MSLRFQQFGLCVFVITGLLLTSSAKVAADISGHYMEARTCQIYTGPCFANGEVGLAGKDAVMAWSIQDGDHEGVNIAGLSVVVIVRTSDTLGFEGLQGAKDVRSMIIVDETASDEQAKALLDFAKTHSDRAGAHVEKVISAPIEMTLDTAQLNGRLKAGKSVALVARKARPTDCICSNESAYYPPLAEVENFAPGVATIGKVVARGIGTTWSIPDSRSAYLATFAY
jgi:hypothetical protein